MENKLDSDIFSNKINYYFSLLGPRFDGANLLLKDCLEKRFGEEWKPIYVYCASPSDNYIKDNYIVLNKVAQDVLERSQNQIILLPEYEDMNIEFKNSRFISLLVDQLSQKQEYIFVYSFTTAFLDQLDSRLTIIGPDPILSKNFDNKINQYQLFKELNLPRNEAEIIISANDLKERAQKMLPFYISAAYTSGGYESGLIYDIDMLNKFLLGIRSINKNGPFLVAKIFDGLIVAPNVNAIVSGYNSTEILIITDQILAKNSYLGNIFPTSISSMLEEVIISVTKKIGNYLSRKGYLGLFGCDFLINDKKIAIVDLNPRRQGGYLCNLLAFKEIGINLVDLELDCVLNHGTDTKLDYQNIQFNGCWAHSKIKPQEAGQRIRLNLKSGNLLNIMSDSPSFHESIFYSENSIFLAGYIGYVVVSDSEYNHLIKNLNNRVNRILSTGLG